MRCTGADGRVWQHGGETSPGTGLLARLESKELDFDDPYREKFLDGVYLEIGDDPPAELDLEIWTKDLDQDAWAKTRISGPLPRGDVLDELIEPLQTAQLLKIVLEDRGSRTATSEPWALTRIDFYGTTDGERLGMTVILRPNPAQYEDWKKWAGVLYRQLIIEDTLRVAPVVAGGSDFEVVGTPTQGQVPKWDDAAMEWRPGDDLTAMPGVSVQSDWASTDRPMQRLFSISRCCSVERMLISRGSRHCSRVPTVTSRGCPRSRRCRILMMCSRASRSLLGKSCRSCSTTATRLV